jgi:hypothetical protein
LESPFSQKLQSSSGLRRIKSNFHNKPLLYVNFNFRAIPIKRQLVVICTLDSPFLVYLCLVLAIVNPHIKSVLYVYYRIKISLYIGITFFVRFYTFFGLCRLKLDFHNKPLLYVNLTSKEHRLNAVHGYLHIGLTFSK